MTLTRNEFNELTSGLTNEDLDILFDCLTCIKVFGAEFTNAVENAGDKIATVQEFKQRLSTVGASS